MTPRLTTLKPSISTIDTRRGAPVAVERIRGGRLRSTIEAMIFPPFSLEEKNMQCVVKHLRKYARNISFFQTETLPVDIVRGFV